MVRQRALNSFKLLLVAGFSLLLVNCSTANKRGTLDSSAKNLSLVDKIQSEVKKDQSIKAINNLKKVQFPLSIQQIDQLSDSMVVEARRGVSCSSSLISALEKSGGQIGEEALSLFKSDMVLCLPVLRMALSSNNPEIQRVVSRIVVSQTRLKRFEQIQGLHDTVLKKHLKSISTTIYATELIRHALIHKNLAEGLKLSRSFAEKMCSTGSDRYCKHADQHRALIKEIKFEQATQRSAFAKLSKSYKKKDASLAWGVISISFAPYLIPESIIE